MSRLMSLARWPVWEIVMSLLVKERRFNELARNTPKGTLSLYLSELESRGFVERRVNQNTKPPMVTYCLSEKGKEFAQATLKELNRLLGEFSRDVNAIPQRA